MPSPSSKKRPRNTKKRIPGVSPKSTHVFSYRHRGWDFPTLGFVIGLNAEIIGVPPATVAQRDLSLAESAVHQPVQTVHGEDAYGRLFLKTAALGYSIANNHAFIDGNKRTAFTTMKLTLYWNGCHLDWDVMTATVVMSLVANSHIERQGLELALILGCGFDPTDPNIP